MIQFRRILCPIDLSDPSLRALTYAGAVAKWYGATVTVLHVVPTFEPMEVRAGGLFDPVQIIQPPSRELVLRELRQVAERTVPGVDVTVAAEAGDAAPTIVDQALAQQADLLVMGTHGRSGFDRLVLGSVAESVMKKAPCPVMTVPPHAPGAPAPAEATVRSILCPVDFSPPSKQAIGFALEIARQTGAALTFMHVIEWLPDPEAATLSSFNVPEYRNLLASDSLDRLRKLVGEQPDTGSPIETIVSTGRAYREILRVADERGADLIVMGTQGRGGAGLTLFGSTAQEVVRIADCPVLTVQGTPAPEG